MFLSCAFHTQVRAQNSIFVFSYSLIKTIPEILVSDKFHTTAVLWEYRKSVLNMLQLVVIRYIFHYLYAFWPRFCDRILQRSIHSLLGGIVRFIHEMHQSLAYQNYENTVRRNNRGSPVVAYSCI